MANKGSISGAKIAKGFIRANVNLWGGKNIPALQSLMTFALDPESVLSKYRADPKEKREAVAAIKAVDKLQAEAMKEEEKLEHMRRGFAKLVTNIISTELIISSIDPNAFLTRVVYTLSTSIINNNNLNKKLTPHTFYAIDVATPVERDILKKYAEGIVKLRKLDQEIRTQGSKVDQKYNQLIQKMKVANNKIINNKKKKKKK